MGALLGGTSTGREGFQKPDKGFLGTVFSILEVFDAPDNAFRSLLVGEPGNAFLSLIPGGGSRRVSGTELLNLVGVDDDNFFLSLGAELIASPTMLIGNIGGRTVQGLRAARAAGIGTRLAVAQNRFKAIARTKKTLGRASELAKAKEEVEIFQDALKSLPPEVAGAPLRKAFEVSVPFGPKVEVPLKPIQDTLATIIPEKLRKDYSIFASSKRITFAEDLTKLQTDKSRLLNSGKSTTKVNKKIKAIKAEIAKERTPLIGQQGTERVNKLKRALERGFKFGANDAKTAVILDEIRLSDADALHAMADKGATLRRQEQIIINAEGATAAEVTRRIMHSGAEARGFGGAEQLARADHIAAANAKALKQDALVKIEALSDADPIAKQIAKQKIYGEFSGNLKDVQNKALVTRLKLVEAEKAGNLLSPAMVELIDTQFKIADEQFETLRGLGVKGKPLEAEKIKVAYVRRIISSAAKTFARKHPSRAEAIIKDMSTSLQSAKPRTLFPESTALEANKKARDAFDLDFDFFDEDMIASLLDREVQHYKAFGRAVGTHTFVQIHGIPSGQLKKGDSQTAQEVFTKVGLDPSYAPKNIRILNQHVDDLLRNNTLITEMKQNDPDGLIFGTFKYLDMIAKPFRLGLTSLFPAFNSRNFISNNWLNTMAGMTPFQLISYGVRATKIQNTMRKLSLGLKLKPDELKIIRELQKYRVVNDIGFLKELEGGGLETLLRDKNFIDMDLGFAGIAPKTMKKLGDKLKGNIRSSGEPAFKGFAAPGTGRKFSQFVENNARISHYLWRKDKGDLPFEAMASMNRYLFDYGALTNFERQFMRPLFLFYTFTRKNLPLQIQSSLTDPKLASFYAKVTNIGEGEVPNYLRGSSVFRNPFSPNEVIASLGLPIEELNIANPGAVDPKFFTQLPKVIESVLSQLNPALQIPIEFALGRDLFSNRPLSQIDEPGEFLELLARSLPTSRLVNTVELALDERRTGFSRLVNLMSGLKSIPLSPTRGLLDLRKRQAISSGKFERQGPIVIPKARYRSTGEQAGDPEVRKFTRSISKLQRQITKERKRRAKNKR